MSNLERYARGELLRPSDRRLERLVTRELARVDASTTMQMARLDSAALVETATAAAVSHVAKQAMQEVALLSQVEQSLAQAVPHASGRLATIADLAAIALTEVVAGSPQRLRRVTR